MSVKAITDGEFEATVLKSDKPTIVDFWATWCGPCKALAPKVEQISGEFEGKVNFTKLDVDANPNTPPKYGIRGVPTLILFKNGEVVNQLVGDQTVDALKEFINSAV